MDEPTIEQFLSRIRAEGRSSPAGQYWAAFHKLLSSRVGRTGGRRPPMPLILAASGESNAAKHARLAEQLQWAHANGGLAEAMEFLETLEADKWNEGGAETWHQESYWRP